MPKRIAVLGGGLVGNFIARRLAAQHSVHLYDISAQALANCKARAEAAGLALHTHESNLGDTAAIKAAIAEADLVIGAVPGSIGYKVMQSVLEAKKHYVDISFFPEDPAGLEALARENGVCAVVDIGVMPGLGGIIAQHFAQQFNEPLSMRILVGGLPVERKLPWEYKAPFSPADVIEEYMRPARMMVNGEVRTFPALSDVEHVNIDGIGTLEAFNTDGLRTLLSLPFPDMAEKTLRYPGHAAKISLLKDSGFFSEDAQDGGETPLAFTSRMLFREWKLDPGEQEFTVMRVEATGVKDGKAKKLQCDLLDYTDAEGNSSMARTTGMPAVITAEMLLADPKRFPAGVIAPEQLCAQLPEFDAQVFALLSALGIELRFSEQPA